MTFPNVGGFYNILLDGAKAGLMANEWYVQISGSNIDQALLDFYVNEITLPNVELIEVEKNYRGRKFSAPTGFKYAGDVELTIDMDTNMTIYSFFADKIGAISPFVNGATPGTILLGTGDQPSTWLPQWSPTETFTMTIELGSKQLSSVGTVETERGGTYTIYGAFPSSIGSIDFENGTPGIASFKVVIPYMYFTYTAH